MGKTFWKSEVQHSHDHLIDCVHKSTKKAVCEREHKGGRDSKQRGAA